MGRKLDSTLAVLNGLVGDHLARTQNGLATELYASVRGVNRLVGQTLDGVLDALDAQDRDDAEKP